MIKTIGQWTHHWAQSANVNCLYTENIDSTNAWSKSHYTASSAPTLYIADHQSSGRGRNKNTWTTSGIGNSLLSTWCFTLQAIPHPLLNLQIGFALYEALHKSWAQIPFSLKPPNDIYIGNGKCAGILTEVVSGKNITLHIGIGLNVFANPDIPQVTTESLSNYTTISQLQWSVFCDTLFHHLKTLSLGTHHSQQHLSEPERRNLLKALAANPKNQIQDVLPDGSLTLHGGRIIHWNEL